MGLLAEALKKVGGMALKRVGKLAGQALDQEPRSTPQSSGAAEPGGPTNAQATRARQWPVKWLVVLGLLVVGLLGLWAGVWSLEGFVRAVGLLAALVFPT